MLGIQTSAQNIFVYNDNQKKSGSKKKRKTYDIEEYQLEYKNISKIVGFSFVQSSYLNFFVLTD